MRVPHAGQVSVETLAGHVRIERDAQAAVTPLGEPPFFTGFLGFGGRCDINTSVLAMVWVVSEDSVRLNLCKIEEADGIAWLQNYLEASVHPVPGVP